MRCCIRLLQYEYEARQEKLDFVVLWEVFGLRSELGNDMLGAIYFGLA